MNQSRILTIGVAGAALALTAGTASAATSMITSHDIKDGAVHRVDLSPNLNKTLTHADQAGTSGTVYRVAHYATPGSGAVATVSCADPEKRSQKYVAVAGGVQMLNAEGDTDITNDDNPVVPDSFPGRMDWAGDAAAPKDGRLDGWIVRFGSQQDGHPGEHLGDLHAARRERLGADEQLLRPQSVSVRAAAPVLGPGPRSRPRQPRSDGSVLAPHSTTATRSPSAGR